MKAVTVFINATTFQFNTNNPSFQRNITLYHSPLSIKL